MKKLIYGFLAIDVVIFAILAMNGGLKPPKYDLKPAAFQEAVEAGGFLVDVRTPSEYEDVYIPGATLVNWKGDEFATKIQKYDKSKPIYIYCRSGMRASRAKRKMNKLGFKEVYNLKGGLKAWAKEKLPVKAKNGFDINAGEGGEGC